MEPSKSTAYRVGDWLVQPQLDQIQAKGSKVTIEPRAMDILVYLAERPGEVVSIDELIENVWDGQIVSDNTVYQWIRKLRKALGDDPHHPRYILTIMKKGYRLIAPVSAADPPISFQQRLGPQKVMPILLLLLVALMLKWYGPFGNSSPVTLNTGFSDPAAAAASIAVLPFANHSGDKDSLKFADGVHDEILTRLGQVESLRVISRTSVMKYRDHTVDIPTIARELDVSTILEGGVQISGGRVRVNLQLLDANTDDHIWAETFDRELNALNIFAIQSEIASSIVDALGINPSAFSLERISASYTTDLEAWETYWQGKRLLEERTIEAMSRAVAKFERSIEIDPGFALAFVGLADSLALLHWYGASEPENLELKAVSAIDSALALDPDLGEAWASRAAWLSGEEAEAAHLKSIKLSPSYATAYHWYGDMLREAGQREKALGLYQAARRLDPLSPVIKVDSGLLLEDMGRYDEARAMYESALETHPDFRWAQTALVMLEIEIFGHIDRGINLMLDQARQIEALGITDRRHLDWLLGNIAISLVQLGSHEEAERFIRSFDPLPPALIGVLYADASLDIISNHETGVHQSTDALNGLAALLDGEDEYSPGDVAAMSDMLFLLDYRSGDLSRSLERYEQYFPELFTDVRPRINDNNLTSAVNLAVALKSMGNNPSAQDLLDEAQQFIADLPRMGRNGFGAIDAMIFAQQENDPSAIRALNEALVTDGWRNGALFIVELHPAFDSLRDVPEFKAVAELIRAETNIQRARVSAQNPPDSLASVVNFDRIKADLGEATLN